MKKKALKLMMGISLIAMGLYGCGSKEKESVKETEKVTEKKVDKVEGEILYYDMTLSKDGKSIVDKSKGKHDGILSVNGDITVENNELFLEKGGFITIPRDVFLEEDTITISVWLNNYSGTVNTSALFFGTNESMPVSYYLLNPSNPAGRMKSVVTISSNPTEPYKTEAGISASNTAKSVDGPPTGMGYNHYVTVINKESITAYFNGAEVGSVKTGKAISEFGDKIVAYIGKSAYNDPTFTGFIKELKIYDKELTKEEISKEYEKNKITKESTSPVVDTLVEERADPYIVKGSDGYYYFTGSYPMYGANDKEGYDRVVLRRSKTIEGLKTAEEKVIWDESESDTSSRFIWAPEMHFIGGKWYVFYAGSGQANNVWDINCRALVCKGSDPYNDSWEEVGKFTGLSGDVNTPFSGFSLDMTYFENNGKHYVIWAQSIGNSNLYMAEINPEKPWELISKSIRLSVPEYYWERVSIPVNEGPSVIKHKDKIFIVYSASATGPEYCLGMLSADINSDMMDLKSWTKSKTPLLTSMDLTGEYGPGHNSFTVDENGNDIFVYHSRSQECFENKCKWGKEDPLYDPCRDAKVRTVIWTEDGMPILNGVMPK